MSPRRRGRAQQKGLVPAPTYQEIRRGQRTLGRRNKRWACNRRASQSGARRTILDSRDNRFPVSQCADGAEPLGLNLRIASTSGPIANVTHPSTRKQSINERNRLCPMICW